MEITSISAACLSPNSLLGKIVAFTLDVYTMILLALKLPLPFVPPLALGSFSLGYCDPFIIQSVMKGLFKLWV